MAISLEGSDEQTHLELWKIETLRIQFHFAMKKGCGKYPVYNVKNPRCEQPPM